MSAAAAETRSVATLICVYRGDDPALFTAALHSVRDQQLRPGTESRIYLGVDGPLPPALEAAVTAASAHCFHVHRSAQNQGLARTLNALLAQLQDEAFIFRMDADDLSLPQRYQRQLDHLDAHPDIDVLGSAITEVDDSTGQQREVRYALNPADALARMHQRVPVAHPTVCIRRRVFQAIAGYPVRGTNEDVALWFECVRHGFRFDNLPEPLLRYRLSANFWQRRGWRKAGSELMCYLRGIHSLDGLFTLKYVHPLLRFGLRVMPSAVSKWAYRSARLRGGNAAG